MGLSVKKSQEADGRQFVSDKSGRSGTEFERS